MKRYHKGGRERVSLTIAPGVWLAAAELQLNRSAVAERALQAETRAVLVALRAQARDATAAGDHGKAARLEAFVLRVNRLRKGLMDGEVCRNG